MNLYYVAYLKAYFEFLFCFGRVYPYNSFREKSISKMSYVIRLQISLGISLILLLNLGVYF